MYAYEQEVRSLHLLPSGSTQKSHVAAARSSVRQALAERLAARRTPSEPRTRARRAAIAHHPA